MRGVRLISAGLALALGLWLATSRAPSQGPDAQPSPASEPARADEPTLAPPIGNEPPVAGASTSPPSAPPPEYRWGPATPASPTPAPTRTSAAAPAPMPAAAPSVNPPSPETRPAWPATPPASRAAAAPAPAPAPAAAEPALVAPSPASPSPPMSLRAMRAKAPTSAEPDLENPLFEEPPPPPRSGPPAPASPPPGADMPRREAVPQVQAPSAPLAPAAAVPATDDVQVIPSSPAATSNAYKTAPAFKPDELGRRPIADSSQPILRDRDGLPLVPAPAPPALAEAPSPAPAERPPQPLPELPAPPAAERPVPNPVVPVMPMPMPADRPTSSEGAPPRPAPVNPEAAPSEGAPPRPAPVNPEAGEAPATRAPSPLLLEKIGPATVNRGTALTYELIVRNVTNAPLSHVHVEDDLPPGVQLVSADPRPEVQRNKMVWNFAVLDPGAERRCKVQLMLTAVGEMNSCALATFEVNACLRTTVTQPHLVLKKTGPASVNMGEKAVFQLELLNDGNGPAMNVVLYDCLPQGLEHPQGPNVETEIGTLAPGESKKITLETRAVQPGRLINHAKATGEGLCVTAEATVMVTAPALALRKNGPRTRFIGREAEFDIEIQNPGSAPATNVQILDRIPQGLDFVSASDNGTYDPETRSVLWNLNTLNPGQREGISLKLVGKTEGDFTNQAFARADHSLEARAEAPIRIDGVAALMLEVVDLDDPVEVGNETVYEIHVINQGSSACSKLQITATAPEGMVPRSGTGPSTARISGQQIVFEPVDRLAPHADATYRVRVLCRTAGDWRFRVQMRCDQLRTPVLEEESTRIYADQ